MRIAFFFYCFEPTVNGVVGIYRRTLDHLAARGHELQLFVPPGSPAVDRAGEVVVCPGFEIPRAPGYHVPFAPRDLAARLEGFAPDLVHVVDPWVLSPLGNVAIEVAHRLGIPSLVAYHTHHARYLTQYGLAPLQLLVERLDLSLCQRADRIIAPSQEALDLLGRHGTADLALWRGGVDTSLFHPDRASAELRARLLGDDPTRKLLVGVGRLMPEKNLDFLCRLVADRPDLALAIAGEGPERTRLARLLPEGRGHLLGNLPHPELARLYASADVHVLSSTTEVQGLTVIESLSCGTPVVVADAGGPAEAIHPGLTGEAVPPGDAAAFLAAIDRWVEPDQATRDRCRQSALAWDWDRFIGQIEDHYDALLSRSRDGGRRARRRSAIDALGAFTIATSMHVPMPLHRALWRRVLAARPSAAS